MSSNRCVLSVSWGRRYDSQILCFGKTVHEKVMNLKYFLVGAGAIGSDNEPFFGWLIDSGLVRSHGERKCSILGPTQSRISPSIL